jgi:hypothetical protein
MTRALFVSWPLLSCLLIEFTDGHHASNKPRLQRHSNELCDEDRHLSGRVVPQVEEAVAYQRGVAPEVL